MKNKTAVSMGFQGLLIKATKYAVIFLSVLTLMGVFWSTAKLAQTYGSKFEAPVYGAEPTKLQRKHGGEIDSSAEGKLALTNKHGEDVIKLLGKHNLNKDQYFDQIIGSMLRIPTDLQGEYVDSAENWLETSTKSGVNAEQSLLQFDSEFHQAVSIASQKEASAEIERASWLGATIGGATFLACLVIVLVLIQIEANTRLTAEVLSRGNAMPPASSSRPLQPLTSNQGAQASSGAQEKAAAKPAVCPKCGATITGDEVFCEGCGSKLK